MKFAPEYIDDTGSYYFCEARWGLTLLKHGGFNVPHQESVFQELVRYYSSSLRSYHDLSHLEACFTILDTHFPNVRDVSLEMALWFHDFVYDADDNEVRSARAAAVRLEYMGFSKKVQDDVASLILMTRHTASPVTDLEKILVDVDLSILGEHAEIFDKYEVNVRKEYDWVPLDHYQYARRKILQSFLDREKIFSTQQLQSAGYEERARINISRSLATLPTTEPLQSW